MRRGCIAVGKIQCDGCHRFLEYRERYLTIDDEGGKKQRLCVDCCLSRSYAAYTTKEGEQTITFFPKD